MTSTHRYLNSSHVLRRGWWLNGELRRAQWLLWNTGSCCKSPHCTARSCWEFYFRAGKCEIWNVKVKLWHFHIHPRLHPIISFKKAYLCSFLQIKCSFIIHSALLQGPCAEWVYICRKLFFESTLSAFFYFNTDLNSLLDILKYYTILHWQVRWKDLHLCFECTMYVGCYASLKCPWLLC